MTVSDAAGGASPATSSLSGTGVAPSATIIAVAPPAAPGVFPSQQVGTKGPILTFNYVNSGMGPITVNATGATLTGGGASSFAIDTNGCISAVLASGASCGIGVHFQPTATGARTASLQVTDLAGGAPVRTLALSGSGIAPTISVAGTSSFGSVTVPTAHTFTVTNTGTAPIGLSALVMTSNQSPQGSNHFAITGGTCSIGTTVAAGSTCTIVVSFSPVGTTVFNDVVSVSGTGIGAGAPIYSATRAVSGR
jgi:hypothetical protein